MGSGAEEAVISPTLLWTASMSGRELGLDIMLGVETTGWIRWVSGPTVTVRWMSSEVHEFSEVTYAISVRPLPAYSHLDLHWSSFHFASDPQCDVSVPRLDARSGADIHSP